MSPKIPAAAALLLATSAAVPAVLPASAVAAPVVELRVAQARPSPALDELQLSARCAQACTLRLRELNVAPYRTRGGVEQLPHSAIDPLSISRRLPAGKQVAIRVPVPPAVRRAVAAAVPRGVALVGNLVTEVTTAGGEPLEVPRRFTVTGPGTPPPFPATPYDDAIRLPQEKARRAAGAARYAMTIKGVQRSRWSYDRSTSDGACTVQDRGSGTQTLRFRSLRSHVVQQVIWRTGERKLQEVGRPYSGVYVPTRIDAERDSREEKGSQGCGGPGGGGDGDGGDPQQCLRRGSADIDLIVGLLYREAWFDVSSSILNWRTASTAPDCPAETATPLRDPIDVLDARTRRGENLLRGGSPGKVIIILRASDVTRIGGGTVTTNVTTTVTFRKLR